MRQKLFFAGVLAFTSILPTSAVAGGADQPGIALGVYLGAGGAWSTLDDSVTIQTSGPSNTAFQYVVDTNVKDSQSRLSPWAQIGYAEMIDDVWLWSLALQYKYLGYAQDTLNGANQVRYRTAANNMTYADLSVSIQNEMMLILSFGGVVNNQVFSLGIGSVFYTLHDAVRRVVNQGNFVSENKDTYLLGGAAQLGYNYYFSPTWFLQANYTYIVAVESQFSNMVNRAYFTTGTNAGMANLIISREYNITTQELMVSLNKVFEV